MAWLWWRYCCCCWRYQVPQEDEAAICSTTTSTASQSSLGSASSQNSAAMGQTASRINDFFQRKRTPATLPPEDGNHASTTQPVVDLVNTSETVSTFIPSHASSLPKFPLATPRSPLRRSTRPLTPSEGSPGKPPSKRLKEDVQYLDFPVLMEEETIRYVQNSKVMLIMKGVPGSGKTFITRKIKEVYEDAVLCSADFYFMQNGEYHFEAAKLKDAHESCQETACRAAEENCHVIVIDNTNVRNWEMKFYLNLAREYCYIPLVLEPQTPWAMNSRELARRNSHNLSEEIVAQKIKNYQPIQPVYYGWFLNEVDSTKIWTMGQEWLKEVMKVDDFIQDFFQNTHLFNTEEILNYFSMDSFVDGGNVLHATAKFTGRGKMEGAVEYIGSSFVKGAIGRCFKLHIIGFVITPRTFGARLRLFGDQLELWGNDDYEDPPAYVTQWATPVKYDREPEKEQEEILDNMQHDGEQTSLENEEKVADACHPSVTVIDAELKEDRFHPTWGRGSRAHLTLGCAPGVKPVNTGFDLMNVVRCEQRVQDEVWLTESELCEQKVETYLINGGVLRTYGEGMWVLYPEKEIVVTSMFSACY
ncbi:2',3'-cyclic-nucleotide 3'-phosphodiesterase-like isoform X3 [Panulirus ornatus]